MGRRCLDAAFLAEPLGLWMRLLPLALKGPTVATAPPSSTKASGPCFLSCHSFKYWSQNLHSAPVLLTPCWFPFSFDAVFVIQTSIFEILHRVENLIALLFAVFLTANLSSFSSLFVRTKGELFFIWLKVASSYPTVDIIVLFCSVQIGMSTGGGWLPPPFFLVLRTATIWLL